MKTATRFLLLEEVNETLCACCGIVTKAQRDPYYPREAEVELRADLTDAWNAATSRAFAIALQYGPERFIDAMRSAMSEIRISDSALVEAFIRGKDQVADRARAKKMVAKRSPFFGLFFGMTEQHAIEALSEQLMLSVGELFDNDVTEMLRAEIDRFLSGELPREDFAKTMQDIYRTKISASTASLPSSYFDGLAEHYVVRTRNFGSVYQAKNLGVTKYRIQGILDDRTSAICRTLITSGRTFELKGAEKKMQGMLGASSVSELKQKFPFTKDPLDVANPIPPLHWRCRSWMEYVL
jgi:hypothetical protein